MKNPKFQPNQTVSILKKGCNKPTVGKVTEVTKEWVQVEINGLESAKTINFLKRNGYFDYRGGRYFLTLKSSDK